MTRDEAVSRIQQGLGFRTDKATEIIAALQEEQRDLERGKTLPRFLLLEDQTLSLAAAANSVNLPANFLRRNEKTKIRYTPSGTDRETRIPWKEYDEAAIAYNGWEPAGPKTAVLRKSTIYFFPMSDQAYSLTWDYYQKDDVLTTNVENLWLANAPELLWGGAGRRIALDLGYTKRAETFAAIYESAKRAWLYDTIVQEQEDDIFLGANN